ncbi:hypothethical protein (plasmid) [Ralstonia solanacearum CMR15]|nr:hypothethical protein [Ralstonia solanacearum CMR15]
MTRKTDKAPAIIAANIKLEYEGAKFKSSLATWTTRQRCFLFYFHPSQFFCKRFEPV